MENLSGDEFPLIGTREKRTTVVDFPKKQISPDEGEDYFISTVTPKGLSNNGNWLFPCDMLDENNRKKPSIFYYDPHLGNDNTIPIPESEEENDDSQRKKQVVFMGSKAVVFPDMYYINTANKTDRGFLFNKKYPLWKEDTDVTGSAITVTPCSMDGTTLNTQSIGRTAPSDPEGGDVWLDTSKGASDYKIFDEGSKTWNSVATSYLKIECEGAFKGFKQWDNIFIDGFEPGAVTGINDLNLPSQLYIDTLVSMNMIISMLNPEKEYTDEEIKNLYTEYVKDQITHLGLKLDNSKGFFEKIEELQKAFNSTFTEKQLKLLWEQWTDAYRFTGFVNILRDFCAAEKEDDTFAFTDEQEEEIKNIWAYSDEFSDTLPELNEFLSSVLNVESFNIENEGELKEELEEQWNRVMSYIITDENILKQIEGLNGKFYTLYQCTDDYIVIVGLLDAKLTFKRFNLERIQQDQTREIIGNYGEFAFERRVPLLDFYCECNNRIWGCKFGMDEDGNYVNHIMACKAGDPTNWYSYMGVSSDSYDVSVGTDGAFTGAINFNGYPTFFKSNYVHKIYGSISTNFQNVARTIKGVGEGMNDSMVIVSNRLYFATDKAKEIVVYDGSEVYTISRPLGTLNFESCFAGTNNKKIYFVFSSPQTDNKTLFVYDIDLNQWYKEDCPDILFFANNGYALYFVEKYDDEEHNCTGFRIRSVNEDTNDKFDDDQIKVEDQVKWFAETGEIGYADPFGKYLQKISVRAEVEKGAEYKIEISYDGGEYELITPTNRSTGIRARDFVFIIRRCDFFKLRFSGRGKVTLISIFKSYVQGSDKK